MLQRYAVLVCLMVSISMTPVVARAASGCDSAHAQSLVRDGFHYLDAQRWGDARAIAFQLSDYGKGCGKNFKVANPAAVYSAYIMASAFHGSGDEVHATDVVNLGLQVLEILRKDGGYSELVNAMAPKFAALAAEIKH